MYSDLKNVQIIVALLKKFNIKHLVLSSGSRNVPLVHSVEEDPFFECYSIVDERSAAFFALGLIQELQCPVAICCTSGTAIANYVSAVNEAYYQKLPLLVLTADRNQYYLNQEEDQMIPQYGLFGSAVKKSVQLPFVNNDLDFWACRRMVNEALLELNHNGLGPVHINFPVESKQYSFNVEKLPKISVISRIIQGYNESEWRRKTKILKNTERILVIYGQSAPVGEEEKYYMEMFARKYNCIISVDFLSNYKGEGTIETFYYSRLKHLLDKDSLIPDIVIIVKGNSVSEIKGQLKSIPNFIHWSVREDGDLADPLKKLTDIFQCSSLYFFKYFAENGGEDLATNNYLEDWKEQIAKLPDPTKMDIPYSDMHVAQQFMKYIPENSLLHLANGNSVRLAQYFPKPQSVDVFCHRGTNGIDGSFSSFIAQAYVSKKLSFLLIGDLSFFYDMNAIWNKYVGNNVRVLLVNNNGAGVIQYPVYYTAIDIKSFDKHSGARHNTSAKGWVESQGFLYLSASNKNELEEVLPQFMDGESNKPILLEVFTEKDLDVEIQHQINDVFRDNKKESAIETLMKYKVKRAIKDFIPEKVKKIIKEE